VHLLQAYLTEIGRLLADGAGIIPVTDHPTLLGRGLDIYSTSVPNEVVLDLTSDGTGEFRLSDLTGFDEQFSGDVRIEYPISTTGEPEYQDRRDWSFYRKPGGKVIRLADAPPVGAEVRFTFKARHSVTTATSTVAESHFFAVCNLAAADGCEQLGRFYTQTAESSPLPGDVSIFQSKGREYEKRATTLRARANEVIGAPAPDAGPQAASVTKNWDVQSSQGGDRITHKRRFR
jgi:hypothetical protein